MTHGPTTSRDCPPISLRDIQLMGVVAETFGLSDDKLVYEPKYDGIRVKVGITLGASDQYVTIWSRTGNVITSQIPESQPSARWGKLSPSTRTASL